MHISGKERIFAVDYAKTLGIFLVCIGHFLPAGSTLRTFLYSFHVPLFFLLAGLTTSAKKENKRTILQRLLALCKRVLVPYTIWFWISALPAYFLWGASLSELIRNYLFLNGRTLWNTALWFLPCYFIVMCFFEVICYISGGNKTVLSISAILTFVAAVVFETFGVTECLLGINKCCLMYALVVIGYLVKEHILLNSSPMKIAIGSIVFTVLGVFSCLFHAGDNISIMNVDYNNIYIFFAVAVCMCLSFVIICTVFPRCKLVIMIAKSSLFIMSTHLVVRQLFDLLIQLGRYELQKVYVYLGVIIIPIYIVVVLIYEKLAVRCKVLRRVGQWIGLAL